MTEGVLVLLMYSILFNSFSLAGVAEGCVCCTHVYDTREDLVVYFFACHAIIIGTC